LGFANLSDENRLYFFASQSSLKLLPIEHFFFQLIHRLGAVGNDECFGYFVVPDHES